MWWVGGEGGNDGIGTEDAGRTIPSCLKHVTVCSLFLLMKDKREKQENERVVGVGI